MEQRVGLVGRLLIPVVTDTDMDGKALLRSYAEKNEYLYGLFSSAISKESDLTGQKQVRRSVRAFLRRAIL